MRVVVNLEQRPRVRDDLVGRLIGLIDWTLRRSFGDRRGNDGLIRVAVAIAHQDFRPLVQREVHSHRPVRVRAGIRLGFAHGAGMLASRYRHPAVIGVVNFIRPGVVQLSTALAGGVNMRGIDARQFGNRCDPTRTKGGGGRGAILNALDGVEKGRLKRTALGVHDARCGQRHFKLRVRDQIFMAAIRNRSG